MAFLLICPQLLRPTVHAADSLMLSLFDSTTNSAHLESSGLAHGEPTNTGHFDAPPLAATGRGDVEGAEIGSIQHTTGSPVSA